MAFQSRSWGRSKLAKMVGARCGLPYRDAKRIVNAVLEETAKCIVTGRHVWYYGFGQFRVVITAPRPTARNPKKPHMLYPMPARSIVKFSPAKPLKDAVAKLLNNNERTAL